MTQNFELIVTLGPSNMKAETLREMDSLGTCIYRINGAHAGAEDVKSITAFVRSVLPKALVMVDLPGNKVRTAALKNPFILKKGGVLKIQPAELNYPDFYKHLKKGDRVYANDSIFQLEVIGIEGNVIALLSHSDGSLGANKGMHVQGIHDNIPFLFEKDIALIHSGMASGVDYISLSFVRTLEDVRSAQRVIEESGGHREMIFAKIETKAAVKNLESILNEVVRINVDRGDLSTDVGLLDLPGYQEKIIQEGRKAGKKVFLATQFLKHMESFPIPLIAEVSDLYRTVRSGVSGIQLSEETAVGKYPVECVRTVFEMHRRAMEKQKI